MSQTAPEPTQTQSAALLLARAERTRARDGWLKKDTVRAPSLLDAPEPQDRVQHWRSAIWRLAQSFPNLRVLLANEADYPERLTPLSGLPALLFASGDLPEGDAVAIVGSRKASDSTLRTARKTAQELALADVIVVSGMARGVDTAAHLGVLDARRATTAVFGTGLDRVFPPENAQLADQIAERGCLVSQFPPGHDPTKTSFPVRNAVIAGLSDASLVMEADERSGTRIEMGYAQEFRRPLLLWAPAMESKEWCRTLVNAHSDVSFVESVDDILARLRDRPGL